jgi:hypothetical protein
VRRPATRQTRPRVITIATCTNLAEAELLKSVLESDGIFAAIPNANTPQPLSGFPSGYQLQVAPEDETRGRERLAELAGSRDPEPALHSPPSPPNPPGTGIFQAALIAEMMMTFIFWVQSQRGISAHPPAVEEYLASLAPSVAAWQLGYLGYRILAAISFVGGLLMLFRVRTGWTLYTLSAVLSTCLLWVFPGGIAFGGWNVLGSVQLLLAGGIITFGFSHRRELFGYAPSPSS